MVRGSVDANFLFTLGELHRLIRAYAVLGKEEMAHEALADARAHFAADAVAMRALAQTARDSHLE